MKKITREFKIGCFVLAVLLISFFVINFLRGKDIFNREMYVVSSYDNIEGLVQSDPANSAQPRATLACGCAAHHAIPVLLVLRS